MYLEPLFLSQRVAIVHLLAVARTTAEHLLLLLLAGQSLHLSVVLDDPRGELIFLHQAWLPLGISGLLTPAVQVHALGSEGGVGTEGKRCQHKESHWDMREVMLTRSCFTALGTNATLVVKQQLSFAVAKVA